MMQPERGRSSLSWRSRRASSMTAVVSLVAAGLFGIAVTTASPAAALPSGPAPIAEPGPSNVTADALPAVQIDGVVWSQVIIGDTVFAGGNFTHARPAGSAPGQNQVNRSYLLSYTLSTGVLNASFAPTLNGQVKTVVASPDGSRIYVGGQFTTVNGVTRNRIAAFSTATGALITTFAPSISYTVNALVATNTTVYAGGAFTAVGSTPRTRLAAFSATNGALLGWNPTADATVTTMVLTPSGSKVIVGGAFQNINAGSAYGLAAVDATSGALLPWTANTVVRDAGTNAAINSLSTDGTAIYGTGYVFGTGGNLEGTFSADPESGNINWIQDCHGDHYGAFSANGIVYTVSHAHYCSPVGGYPQTDANWNINEHHATAFTADAKGTLGHNVYGGYTDWYGTAAPAMYNWFPDFTVGTFTGQGQAAWDVTGNSQYVIMGGEFLNVNNVAQQGIVRFAVRPPAPGTQGPRVSGANFLPSIAPLTSHSARVLWQANWDRDNQHLTYRVVRNNNTATPVYTTTADSQFWNRPTLGFTDTGLTPGATYNYKVFALDPSGNTVQGNNVSVTMPTVEPSPYVQDVLNDGATDYWRLGEPSGTTGTDLAGFNNLVEGSTVGHGAAGAFSGDPNTASTFDGSGTGTAATTSSLSGADTFSVETWIKTTSTQGGKIIGFGNTQSGMSGAYDRHVYMDNAGHLIFGVYPGGVRTVSGNGTYNDGLWHHIVATLSSNGMVLYVDGLRVARDTGTTSAQGYQGYWRIGGDSLNAWPSLPTNFNFAGSIDDTSIYPTALTLAQVQAHYVASGRTLSVPPAPSDGYGKRVYNDGPDLYWRLDDASGPTAADTSPNNSPGVYSGGVSYQTPSTVTPPSGTGVTFDGVDGGIGSQQAYSGPTVYSEGVWFKTTTTHGGKLIGFGDQQSGLSSSYDRHVYMENSGQLTFGVWTGFTNTITSPSPYNDGAWHQVVATQGGDGMVLYVDGQSVGTNGQTQAQDYTGYWRVGGDSDWGGDSPYFSGSIDEAAVYLSELTPSQVLAQYNASTGAPANQDPIAAFTQSCTNLVCSFDGSTSSDPGGSVASYAWSFGDTTTGSGVTPPSHAYPSSGTYQVTLTVTDNQGATNAVTHPVSVTASAFLAADAFSRTANNAWGTADTGGVWTLAGVPAANFSVTAGAGRMQLPAAGNLATGYLNGVSAGDNDSAVDFTFDKAPTGTSYVYAYLATRHTGASLYRLRTKVLVDKVQLSLTKVVSGTETVIVTSTIAGQTFTPGQYLRMRLRVSGASSVALSGKLWSAGSPEPAAWQVTATDATSPFATGSPGLAAYLATAATNAPVVARFANFTVGTIAGP
jgi:hypothetical protein